MDYLVSDVSQTPFAIEYLIEQQVGMPNLPFPKMNKSGAGVCTFYLTNRCRNGQLCPFRHIQGDKTIVCKHWLRGLCKKGDDCDFLHEFDMSKMPECYFFSKYGECLNKECPFLHIDPQSKLLDCPWYDRGFCRNGPSCKKRHVRRVACKNYINGFCPSGRDCKFAHPKWWPLPTTDIQENHKQQRWICHNCGERGHKIQFCLKLPEEQRRILQQQIVTRHHQPSSGGGGGGGSGNYGMGGGGGGQHQQGGGGTGPVQHPHHHHHHHGPPKPLDQVTCYKCGEVGHYANKCSKGYLAFLSKASLEGDIDRHQGGAAMGEASNKMT